MINYIITDQGTINTVVGGRAHAIAPDHPNYAEIRDAINRGDEAALAALAPVPTLASKVAKHLGKASAAHGRVTVDDEEVYFDGAALHHVVCDRIVGLLDAGFSIEPMARFLCNLMDNPSRRAVQELYPFLENQALPLTEDGCFLAYKRCKPDFTDCYTGSISYALGTVATMPRNTVDEDWGVACSQGLHVGALSYVEGFEKHDGWPIIVVKVNPRDVVCVPCGANKVRVCEFLALAAYEAALDAAPLYGTDPVAPATPPGPAGVGDDPYAKGPPPMSADGDDDEDDDPDIDDEDDDDDDGPAEFVCERCQTHYAAGALAPVKRPDLWVGKPGGVPAGTCPACDGPCYPEPGS